MAKLTRERLRRIRAMNLDAAKLLTIVERFRGLDRGVLERDGYLLDPPDKGGPMIAGARRGAEGESLLEQAKDVLYAALFGDAENGVRLTRVERELLTLTMPRAKLAAVTPLLRAVTEIGGHGTWRDPAQAADDDRAANVLLQVEYGETADELVGHAIAASLRLINNLEVNEQVLYARMENVEQTTLDD